MSRILKAKQQGTVSIADIDTTSVVTRDLSDEERSAQAIEDYAAAYAAGRSLPAVEVFLVDGAMVLVDGDHRIKARMRQGADSVVALCVGEGTMQDALRHALRANRAHGIRLSPADYRRRIFQALDSGLWDASSANALANDLGCSPHTAAKYMREHAEARGVERPAEIVDTQGRVQPAQRPRQQPTREETAAPAAPTHVELDDVSAPAEGASVWQSAVNALDYVGGLLRQARTVAFEKLPDAEVLAGTRRRLDDLLVSTQELVQAERAALNALAERVGR